MEKPENFLFAILVDLKWPMVAANRSYLLLPKAKKAEATAPLAFIFPGKRKVFHVHAMKAKYRYSSKKTPS
jgi:hypothetical protein